MKTLFFSLATTVALLTTAAASAQGHPTERTTDKRASTAERNDNYGYAKDHKVTAQERARWEAAHKKDQRQNEHDDKGSSTHSATNHSASSQGRPRQEEARKNDRQDERHAQDNDRADERRASANGKDVNYGYPKNHTVTAQERARWEAAHQTSQRR